MAECRYFAACGRGDGACGGAFEPPAGVRGDVARALFYMAVRYDGSEAGTADLELSDAPSARGATMGALSVLLRWHVGDPVDAAERARNDGVFAWQRNRNPFVDHPEFVAEVFGAAGARDGADEVSSATAVFLLFIGLAGCVLSVRYCRCPRRSR